MTQVGSGAGAHGHFLDYAWLAPGDTEYPQARHGCSAYLRKSHALSTTIRWTGLHLVKKQTILPVVWRNHRSEEHTSELQSLMRISYAVFCLKKKKMNEYNHTLIT